MCTDFFQESMKVVLGLLCPEPKRQALGGQPATQCPRLNEGPVKKKQWGATRVEWVKPMPASGSGCI
jgi:hypothetical protein